MIHVHDVVARLQFGEIAVKAGALGAGTLAFLAGKRLKEVAIPVEDQTQIGDEKAFGQRGAEKHGRARAAGAGVFDQSHTGDALLHFTQRVGHFVFAA